MTLRLTIKPPEGDDREFLHPGPEVHVGRDPTAELALDHAAVSWRHARIEVAPEGSWITDLGSSNGTFLNNQRVVGRVPLPPGALIGFGQGGPRLVVLGLPSRPTRAEGPRQAPPQPVLADPAPPFDKVALGAVAVLGVLLLLIGMVVWSQASRLGALSARADALEAQKAELTRQIEELKKALASAPRPAPDRSGEVMAKLLVELNERLRGIEAGREKPLAPPKPLVTPDKDGKEKPPPAAPPSPKRDPVGMVGAAVRPYPIVLAERPADGGAWEVVTPDTRISSGTVLATPMLCRVPLVLDSGVRLVLWGDADVPRDRPTLRAYDARLTLNAAPAGIDADMTLGRGRVVVGGKPRGQSIVRVRFRDYIWDVTLPEGTTLALDLRQVAQPAASKANVPAARLMFIFRGAGVKVAEHKEYPGYPNDDDFWVSPVPEEAARAFWPALSGYWDGKEEDLDKEMAAALVKFRDAFTPLKGGLGAGLARMAREEKGAQHMFAVLALAAIDDVDGLAAALGDPKRPRGRLAALAALRYWAGMGEGHPARMTAALVKAGADEAGARLVEEMSRPIAREDAETPEKLAAMVAGLSSPSLAVRQAAVTWLLELLPDGEKFGYDPAGDEKARAAAVKMWLGLIAPKP